MTFVLLGNSLSFCKLTIFSLSNNTDPFLFLKLIDLFCQDISICQKTRTKFDPEERTANLSEAEEATEAGFTLL